jgi:hypothetical protein
MCCRAASFLCGSGSQPTFFQNEHKHNIKAAASWGNFVFKGFIKEMTNDK